MAPMTPAYRSLLGLIPLSALLGVTTEALASYTSGTVGGVTSSL